MKTGGGCRRISVIGCDSFPFLSFFDSRRPCHANSSVDAAPASSLQGCQRFIGTMMIGRLNPMPIWDPMLSGKCRTRELSQIKFVEKESSVSSSSSIIIVVLCVFLATVLEERAHGRSTMRCYGKVRSRSQQTAFVPTATLRRAEAVLPSNLRDELILLKLHRTAQKRCQISSRKTASPREL